MKWRIRKGNNVGGGGEEGGLKRKYVCVVSEEVEVS